jgi:DNA-binding beta-propeller fold protein YncE
MKLEKRKDDPYVGAGIFLAVVLFLLYVYPGFLIPLSSHFDGSCTSVPLTMSAEDLRIDPTTGLAYLTYYDSVDQRTKRRVTDSSTGTVMLVDLNAQEPHVRAALSTEPAGFKPSGLSLFTKPDGTKRLFVTSRSELGKHTVEVFDQQPTGAFAPAETIRDRLLWSPTAIVAVGPRQFYVVNQLGFKRSFEDAVANARDRLRGNQSTVVYYDGEHMKIVASGLNLASGIGISPDGRSAYVAESAGGRIQVFYRNPSTGALTRSDQRIDVPGAPHNITVASDGTLWVSSHPHAVPFMEFVRDPSDRAPTQVLRITPTAGPEKQVEEVYVDDGNELSAGTVVAPHNANQFVMGSRSDHKLLVCTRAAGAKPAPPPAGPE